MEVTQIGPFKEAWAHDFAPPIHSLDRHGDFAPPLLALGLAAGFFGVATDDDSGLGGLQYNIAQVYGPENLGDWLYVETTSHGGPNDYGMNFVASDPIVFRSESFIDWFSDGGTINTDPGGFGINASGITVTSNGDISLESTTGDDISLLTSGTGKVNIEPHGDCNIDPAGNCEVHLAPGKTFTTYDHLTAPLSVIQEDSTAVHNLGNGKTLTINDHLGSPLVTYTG